MKMIGNDIFVQRGESCSLDFSVKNQYKAPFVILKNWENPYMMITISTNRFSQTDGLKIVYWLDLKNRIVQQANGTTLNETFKTFVAAEPLYLVNFSIEEALEYYSASVGGKIVLNGESEFDITNFLFYTDPLSDGNRVYKYVSSYTPNEDSTAATEETWQEYDFRVLKSISTTDLTEQSYLYDIKIVSGESIQQHVARILNLEDTLPWTDATCQTKINEITDTAKRMEMQTLFDTGVPLMPIYDVNEVILTPAKLFVNTNL